MQYQGIGGGQFQPDPIGSQHGDAWSIKGADVTRSRGQGSGQVDDTVHQHQSEETDLQTGKSMHDKPVFERFKQPDNDRGEEDHQGGLRVAQGFKTGQKFEGNGQGFFAQARWHQVFHQPAGDAFGCPWEHGSQQKDQ